MADKHIDPAGGGLGNVTELMTNVGVSDLSWLVVDEAEYRKNEALPCQNLDVIPELQQALAMDPGGEGHAIVPARVPAKSHVVVNQNPLERPRAAPFVAASVVRNRTARYVMAGLAPGDAARRLQSEFAAPDLEAASIDSLRVAGERGLLGNVYIDASHFPRCAQDGEDRRFVATHAKRALFIMAKDECGGCIHNCGGSCNSLRKRIVNEVPYDEKTLAHYAVALANEGRPVDFGAAGGAKAKLRAAFLRVPMSMSPETPATVQTLPRPKIPVVTAADVIAFVERRTMAPEADPMPGPLYVRAARRVMLGAADPLSLASSDDDEVRKLASDHGILGHTFLDMDALKDCRQALELIRAKKLAPDFVIRRSASCTHCMDASDGACCKLREISTIVRSRPTIGRENFAAALRRASSQGRISSDMAEIALRNAPETSNWRSLTAQANLIQAPPPERVYDGPKAHAHHVSTAPDLIPAEMDPEEVRRTISHLMNNGLHGRRLQAAVLSRYSRSDLAQVPGIGARLASDEGIQGTWFIDPTAYQDYGRGCTIGATHFRKRGAENVFAGPACTGCTFQTAPGWCSKYAKHLVRSVPQDVRESITSSRRHLPMVAAPVEDPVERYGLTQELMMDIPSRPASVDIEMADRAVE